MIQITGLFLYKLIFMANLLIAETLFLFRMNKKPHYPLRMFLCTLSCFVFVFLFPLLSYNAVYSSIMFFTFFMATILAAKICYDIDWRKILFCTVAGYSVQHVASVCYDIVMTVSHLDNTVHIYSNHPVNAVNPFQILIFIQIYALVYWSLFYAFSNRIKRGRDISIKNVILLMMLALTVLVEIVLNAFVIYRKYDNLDMTYYLSASIANIICSLAVLGTLFGFLTEKTLEKELDIVYQMWRQEHKQFHVTRETINLINTKCHDMKHQIHSLNQGNIIEPDALREMEETISIYDAIAKTGNQALDIILAEKSLFCAKNKIIVSYIADGKKLDFMKETDIYSLFGNLLDNAIQAVVDLEQDKRIISLTIRAEGELLSINSHNYYGGDIRMVEGFPVTENPDKDQHGFGVKSMAMIVEKYSGSISFETKEQVFNLNILIPILQAEDIGERNGL